MKKKKRRKNKTLYIDFMTFYLMKHNLNKILLKKLNLL